MSKRTCGLLLVGFLLACGSRAIGDPFVGKWKLNQSKSKIIDEMKVQIAGTNKYAFNFGGGFDPEVIVSMSFESSRMNVTACHSLLLLKVRPGT